MACGIKREFGLLNGRTLLLRILRRMLAVVIASSALNAAPFLPELRPKVGSPVLQQLMGGCSLRCAYFWDTWAGKPGSLKPSSELCDDDAMTAWISPEQGSGEIIEFRIPKHLPPSCRDTPFYGISVANGLIRSLPEYRAHARVKTMTLLVDGQPLATLHLADTWRWQDFYFDDIPLNQGDIITLSIDELYPGKTTQQPAITEIVLQGAH
jgi:hypothetical protein